MNYAGTFLAMKKEIVGLDALSAGKPMKEAEALALCWHAGVEIARRWVTSLRSRARGGSVCHPLHTVKRWIVL